eukprot:SAG31_NODE_3364_length_4360_cov_2.281155_1_plen_74_part_10
MRVWNHEQRGGIHLGEHNTAAHDEDFDNAAVNQQPNVQRSLTPDPQPHGPNQPRANETTAAPESFESIPRDQTR